MKPCPDWKTNWICGIDVKKENELADSFIFVFSRFWLDLKIDNKSKKTQRRYSNALKSLGGYLIKQAVSHDELNCPPLNLLMNSLTPFEGPLIYFDNEAWQDEIDLVCRKLYKHIESNTINM